MRTTEMMSAHPAGIDLDRDLLARTVDSLMACARRVSPALMPA